MKQECDPLNQVSERAIRYARDKSRAALASAANELTQSRRKEREERAANEDRFSRVEERLDRLESLVK